MKQFSVLLIALGLALSASAQTKTLLNLEKTGVAIQGYDPVAFFTQNAPVKGRPELMKSNQWRDVPVRFQKDKELFDKEPAKYEPIFGGYCAFGVSKINSCRSMWRLSNHGRQAGASIQQKRARQF